MSEVKVMEIFMLQMKAKHEHHGYKIHHLNKKALAMSSQKEEVKQHLDERYLLQQANRENEVLAINLGDTKEKKLRTVYKPKASS